MFADEKQSPVFFYGVPESVKFGIYFKNPSSFEFESLEELKESCVVKTEGGYGYKWEGENVLSEETDEDDSLTFD